MASRARLAPREKPLCDLGAARMTDVTMGLDGLSELKFSKELEAAINEVRAISGLCTDTWHATCAYCGRCCRSIGDAVHRPAGFAEL